MKSKQVLFVGNYLQAFRGTVGPAQKVLTWLKIEEGIEVQFTSQQTNQLLRALDIMWTIIRIRPKRIIVDTYSGKAFLITVLAFLLGKIVSAEIYCFLRGGKLWEFYNAHPKLVKFILSNSNKLFSPSKFLISQFKASNLDVNYFPNPLRLDIFPYKEPYKESTNLLWVRAFKSIYNPEVPIKVLAAIREEFPEATLTLVGPEGPLTSDIKKLASTLNVSDAVKFVGAVPNDTLYKYYHTHRIFLNTTSYESFGMAVVEAASCGIPVVSNQVGELPYLWKHNESILFVNENNIEEYVQQIKKVWTNIEFANQLSQNARRNAESFDWMQCKQKWIELILH